MSISIIGYAINQGLTPAEVDDVVTDWAPIINACIQDHPWEIITFTPRKFKCSSTILVGLHSESKPVVLRGEISDWEGGTHLVFPAGVQAMTISAPRSRVEDIGVIGPGRTSNPSIARAVLVEGPCELKRFTVYKFNGIEISADKNRMPPTYANNWYMERCVVKQCGSDGVYVHGGDTNNGVAIAISVTDCYGDGIRDNSAFGCRWVGAHVVATASRYAYRAENPGSAPLFLGCYAEKPAPISLKPHAMWIGGEVETLKGGGVTLYKGSMHNTTIVNPTLRAIEKIDDIKPQPLCRIAIPGVGTEADQFYILSYDGRLSPDGTPKYPHHFGWVRALYKNKSTLEAFGFSFGKAQSGGGKRR